MYEAIKASLWCGVSWLRSACHSHRNLHNTAQSDSSTGKRAAAGESCDVCLPTITVPELHEFQSNRRLSSL
ncbi:unnamed protein product [Caretta caretta]